MLGDGSGSARADGVEALGSRVVRGGNRENLENSADCEHAKSGVVRVDHPEPAVHRGGRGAPSDKGSDTGGSQGGNPTEIDDHLGHTALAHRIADQAG
jgi:hypothetical protein